MGNIFILLAILKDIFHEINESKESLNMLTSTWFQDKLHIRRFHLVKDTFKLKFQISILGSIS